MKATEKSPEIDGLLESITGRNRKQSVENGVCTTCGGEAKEFRDALSEKEFTISGMCQECQDSVFGRDDYE